MNDLLIRDDAATVTLAAADLLNELAEKAMSDKGAFSLVLSGGKTPAHLYAALARRWAGRKNFLSKISFFWGDERCVPPEHPYSNYGLAEAAMLSKLDLAEENIHRIKGEMGAEQAANLYEKELRACGFKHGGEQFFDCVLLGMGRDGHTASLFPGRSSLWTKDRLVTAELEPGQEPFVPRVTMTLPALSLGREIIFMACGIDKAGPFRNCLAPGAGVDDLPPAGRVVPVFGRTTFIVDQAAAARIRHEF